MMNFPSPFIWLFLSGAIALTFEVIWTRYFQILLGNTVYSFSWVTGAFLLGISLGAYGGGILLNHLKKDDSAQRTIQFYLWSEVAVFITSLASFSILIQRPDFLVEFLSPKNFFKDGLVCSIFIIPSTFSMGVGLPLLTHRFGKELKVEKLYAINTLGGGLGLLLLSFIGVIFLGYQGLLVLVYVLNLFLIGLVLLFLKRPKYLDAVLDSDIKGLEEQKSEKRFFIFSFLSGFILLGLEAVWFRTSELILNDRSYIATLVLFIVLTLLGLASFFTPRIVKKFPHFLPFFISGAILSLIGAELMSDQAFLIARDFPRVTPVKILYLLLTFIIPLMFLSFIFPRILVAKKWSGKVVAHFLFANTLGGLFGTLLVSYGLIGRFGMKSFYLIAFSLLPLFILLELKSSQRFKRNFILFATLPLMAFFLIYSGEIKIHRDNQVLESQELPQGLFSLVVNNKKRLEMYNGNYRIVAPYRAVNGEHAQKALAYFPALFHSSPKKVLTMGTGYGISISAFLELKPDTVEAVEVHPMVNQVSYHFKDLNSEWYLNPAVETFIDDARGYLTRSQQSYDLISSNIASPYTTSGSLFLTQEYFQEVSQRLNPGGIYSQLVWGPHLKEIIHTFKSIFPHVKAYPGYAEKDLILIGSKSPLTLKLPSHTYDNLWPFYQDHRQRATTIELGERLLKLHLSSTPEFLISDHSAVLTHNLTRGLNFFWIHR